MVWANFLICLFLGVFGIHKFREKKIGMGILYLFTGGLFLIGWFCDCMKYFFTAIRTVNGQCDGKDKDGYPALSAKQKFLWIVVFILAIIALANLHRFVCVLLLAVISLILPLTQWQNIINSRVKKNIKTIAVSVLALVSLIALSAGGSQDISSPDADTVIEETIIQENDNIEDADSLETHDTNVETEPALIDTTTDDQAETVADEAATEEIAIEETIVEDTLGEETMSEEAITESVPQHIHEYQSATCSTPATCTSCGETDGSPLDHSWNEATCTSAKSCSLCGEIDGYALGHNYSSGYCTSCGSNDPNYVSEAMVWIPTNGGSKYHSKSSCSNMIDPQYVTITDAQNRGFTACGRCY